MGCKNPFLKQNIMTYDNRLNINDYQVGRVITYSVEGVRPTFKTARVVSRTESFPRVVFTPKRLFYWGDITLVLDNGDTRILKK